MFLLLSCNTTGSMLFLSAKQLMFSVNKLRNIRDEEKEPTKLKQRNNEFCLFVYFHQISFTMNNNKINGYNRNKTMKKN